MLYVKKEHCHSSFRLYKKKTWMIFNKNVESSILLTAAYFFLCVCVCVQG